MARTPFVAGNLKMNTTKAAAVDLLKDGSAATVIDYKMPETRLSLYEVYYGLSLQLLTYLLVLQASGETTVASATTLPSAPCSLPCCVLSTLRDIKD